MFPGPPERGIVQKLQQRLLMVSLEEHAFESRHRIIAQTVEHLPGLKPAIDIIAEENHNGAGGGLSAGIRAHLIEKRAQQVVAAVNIADRIEAEPLGHFGRAFGSAESAAQPADQFAEQTRPLSMPPRAVSRARLPENPSEFTNSHKKMR